MADVRPEDAPSDAEATRRASGEGNARRGRPGKRVRQNRPTLSVSRHQSRILALQVIYEVDVTDHELEEVIARSLHDPEEEIPPDVETYALQLARGATAHQDQIDAYIGEAAPAFPVPQLASVDRNVLRVAIYELLYEPDVPLKAAINEAVELAKRYGGLNSSRFVNGVLGTVMTKIEGERATGGASPPDGASPPRTGE